MGISPASMNQVTFVPQLYDADDSEPVTQDATAQTGAQAVGADGAFDASSALASLQNGIASFCHFLQREFKSLERQFSAAFASIVKGAHAAAHSRSNRAVAATPASISPYDGLIRRAAARNEIDPALIRAVMKQESGFRPDAVSPAGALGLMQLMPETARDLGVDPLDPGQNVEGGARLLRTLLDRYAGRIDLALAAYNAGPAAVDKYGGVPPFPETQSYVRDVTAAYRAFALAS